MAIFTDIGGQYVSLVLAGCINTVMTARTIIDDTCVIKIRRSPRNRSMTIVAVVAARNMCRVFADRDRAVVAGRAGINYLGVIDQRRGLEERCAVAILTDVCRQNMILVFTGCVGAIVTTYAIACDVGVIEGCRYPAGGRMTIIAIVTTRNMRRVFANGDCSVMTRCARTKYLRMVYPVDGNEQD